MRRNLATVVALLLWLATVNIAQDGGSTQRLDFPKAKTSTYVKGKVDLMNPAAYVLPLRVGQRLTVKLKGSGVLVQLLSPTNRIEVKNSQRFDQRVQETGDYSIIVHCYAAGNLRYGLDVRLR